MKRVLLPIVVAAVIAGVTVFALSQRRAPVRFSGTDSVGQVPVVASFYPLAEFARQVGGGHVAVTQMTPAGVDAHDSELSPQHLITIQSAKLFLYNGGGFEPWGERIHEDVEQKGVRVINMLRALGVETGELAVQAEEETTGHEEPEEDAEQEHRREAGGINPHIWLDPVLAQRQVELIRDALIEMDPVRAEDYRANAEHYLAELQDLDQAFRDGLASCPHRGLIVAHDGFRHLAERYGLQILPLAGLSPEAEARPRHLAEAARHARAAGIRTVFSEVLVSSRITETFAKEIGAQVRPLHPLEGLTPEELKQGKDYLLLMHENLLELREGLGCR